MGKFDDKKLSLGIEFGSTRIKACLIDDSGSTVSSGVCSWENKFENGYWTYDMQDVITGMQGCYQDLVSNYKTKYGEDLYEISAIGISGMMHGYIPLDKDDKPLVPFRTWRNTTAEKSSKILTEQFKYPIPARWSVAHLYQAILNKESHISQISHITTLAGYIHFLLTDEKIMGIGEASGMFPIDIESKDYNADMLAKFDDLVKESELEKPIAEILPKVAVAGAQCGMLSESGAKILDIKGKLKSGVPFCPPEGDAGTGMIATNSVEKRKGNISAGTSIFGMVVLEKELSKVYGEIDLVTTPNGNLVAMVHCNNCSSEINSWINLFSQVLSTFGVDAKMGDVFDVMFEQSLKGEKDCGGMLTYNYTSGEHATNVLEGYPMFIKMPNGNFNLANFMKAQLYSAFVTLKIGFETLAKEDVFVDLINAHGGIFKKQGVAQNYLASAINTPVAVSKNATEGGAWGMAVLASFMLEGGQLQTFLKDKIFINEENVTAYPSDEEVLGIDSYTRLFKAGLKLEINAAKCFK